MMKGTGRSRRSTCRGYFLDSMQYRKRTLGGQCLMSLSLYFRKNSLSFPSKNNCSSAITALIRELRFLPVNLVIRVLCSSSVSSVKMCDVLSTVNLSKASQLMLGFRELAISTVVMVVFPIWNVVSEVNCLSGFPQILWRSVSSGSLSHKRLQFSFVIF